MTLSIKTLKRYAMALTSNSVGLAIAMVSQIVFARALGTASYGLMALATSLVLLAINLFDGGVTSATPRFLAKNIGAEDHHAVRTLIRKSGLFVAVYSLFLCTIMLLLSPLVSNWFSMPGLRMPFMIMAGFTPMICLFNWALCIIKGLGHNPLQIFLMSPFLQTLTFALGFGLWLASGTVNGVVTGLGMAYAITGLTGLGFVIRFYRGIDAAHPVRDQTRFRDVLWYGLPLNFTSLAQRILRRSDAIVIGAMLGESAVGIYRAAFTVAAGVKQLMQPINSFALFQISRGLGQKGLKHAIQHYDFTLILTLALALPGYLICMTMSDEIIRILFGADYYGAGQLLVILAVGFSVFTCTGPIGQLFNAIGRNWRRFWMVLGISGFNIALNILLVSWIGISGAAVATVISFIALFGLYNATLRDMPGGIRTRLAKVLTLILVTFYIALIVNHLKVDALFADAAISALGGLVVLGLGGLMLIREIKTVNAAADADTARVQA